MSRHIITIVVESDNLGAEKRTGVDEALFDFGIQNPHMDSKEWHEWPNMRGIQYEITDIEVRDV